MITKIQGEQPFQVLTNNFSISPSNEGYTLQISADGKQYSNLFSVGAGVTRLVTGVAANSFYRLLGNQSAVSVNWMKTCVTEGSGAAGNELIPQESLPATADAGTVVALTNGGVYQYDGTDWNPVGGSDMSAYWTSAETKTYADSADTIIYNSATTHIEDVERIMSSALNEFHTQIMEVSAKTAELSAYTPTTGFSTINGSAITDGSAIVIEAGGDIAPLSAAVETISAATAGKADAVSITANPARTIFPKWNSQGIITGEYAVANMGDLTLNGTNKQVFFFGTGSKIATFYAPTTSGNPGDILVSTGNGAPVWSGVTIPANPVQSTSIDTIWKGTQAEYDALAPNYDPNTFYIIVSN